VLDFVRREGEGAVEQFSLFLERGLEPFHFLMSGLIDMVLRCLHDFPLKHILFSMPTNSLSEKAVPLSRWEPLAGYQGPSRARFLIGIRQVLGYLGIHSRFQTYIPVPRDSMLKFLLSRIPEDVTRPNILIVDEDHDMRAVIDVVLTTSGVGRVHEAASGQQGLDLARKQRIDVILLDMRLPDISFETVIQLLKADPWTREIPVLLLTADARECGHVPSLPTAGRVPKPLQPQQLCTAVRAALANSKAGAELPRKAPQSVLRNHAALPMMQRATT
jgi:CheY-like chemotaxis protein